ncbi:hypothetical protein FB451DRAFT_1488751 [Mycena latifolia]|nr:hypothetical protein FB451DRAFT_1488751 [Mycena latifolia]
MAHNEQQANASGASKTRAMAPLPRGVTPGRLAAGNFFKKALRGGSSAADVPGSLPSDPSDNSSSDSGSSSNYSDEDGSGSEQHRASSLRLSSKQKRGHNRKQKMLLKPIPPSRYNSDANANAIQRFAREAKTYVKMGRVPADEQVYFVSYYLDRRALDFYNQVVVPDEESWDLEKFFIELFEFCFLADFHNKQRKRLERCYQGAKDVAAHVAEWSEIWNTIGLEDTQEKIMRLFNSFTYAIQGEIYRKGFDPEESTWDEIVKAAEQAEILLKLVTKNQDTGSSKRPPQSGQKTGLETRAQSGPSRPSRGGFRGRGRGHGGCFNGAPHPREEILRTSPVGVPGKQERSGEQLSPQKCNEMLAKGLCFACGEARHLARNCPKNNTVPSKKKGKPPGFSTHAMRLQSGSTSRDALYESTEVLETLHVGAILSGVEGGESIQILETFSDSDGSYELISESNSDSDSEDSQPQESPCPIGDLYVFYTAMMLQAAQPYPGDLKPCGPEEGFNKK